MPSRERKYPFLDDEDSNDEADQGRSSEEELEKGGRSAKRRKLDDEESGDEASVQGDDGEADEMAVPRSKASDFESDTRGGKGRPDFENTGAAAAEDQELLLLAKPKPLSKKNLVVTDKAIKKSGVVYISRIPPYMKPAKLRNLLEPFGRINRTFLTPEDPQAHARRVRNGGNKRKLFTEGWVEFVDKKEAKIVCELLNGQIVGGKKGNFYHDDMWNLRYLKHFKWHHLTEQIAREQAERASRMRAEISKATRENKEFIRNVELGKQLEGMRTKASAKRKKIFQDDGEEVEEHVAPVAEPVAREKKRTFKQTPLARKKKHDAQPGEQSEHVKRVLSKIF